MQKYSTKSAEETQKIGEELAIRLRGGDILALTGDLGYGKTTFVQGLARGLGISQRVISPTFIIVRTYELKVKDLEQSEIQRSRKKSKILSKALSRNEVLSEGDGKSSEVGKNAIQNAKVFYHIDLYRISSENDLRGLGLEEILSDKEAIVVIEWAEKLGELLPKNRIEINFEYIDDTKREITINKK